MELLTIPKVGANIEEATLGAWLKELDESVGAGEPVIELITDKANFELEAEGSGVLRAKLFSEKSTVPIGCVIGIIAEPDEPLPDVSAQNQEIIEKAKEKVAIEPRAVTRKERKRRGKKVPATGAARRLARELGLDLEEVFTAEGGSRAVTEEMVQAFAGEKQ